MKYSLGKFVKWEMNNRNMTFNTIWTESTSQKSDTIHCSKSRYRYINPVRCKNNDTWHTNYKRDNISGDFSTFSDNATFMILPSSAEWTMGYLCACERSLLGSDSSTSECGKHRWLLLLLLPSDLHDLLHKDNRAVSYPQDTPTPCPKNSHAWQLRQRTSSRLVWWNNINSERHELPPVSPVGFCFTNY